MAWRHGAAYSQDLRDRVFTAFDSGIPVGRIAEMLLVSVSYVSKALSRRERTGETTARPQRCHVPPKLLPLHDAIRAKVDASPDITLNELQAWLLSAHAVSASQSLLWTTLKRLNLTLKKRPFTPPSRPAPMSPRRGRPGAPANRRSTPLA